MAQPFNPWVSMWSHPRATIRYLFQTKPRYGVFLLAAVYTLQALFYFANYASFGHSFSFATLFFGSLALAFPLGILWLYLVGWILVWAGRLCGGKADSESMRLVAAWSRIPFSLNIFMWVILFLTAPDTAFLQRPANVTLLFINFIAVILWTWSVVLRLQAIREIQGFSIARSFACLFLSWVFYYVIMFSILMIFRGIYINLA